MTLLRSNIEFAKRVFLDRLTVDQQPLDSPQNIDGGPGTQYVYANCGNSGNFGVGFDCSGLCGVVLPIAIHGPDYFAGSGYFRLFSTETFPGPLTGFRRTSHDDLVNGNYPLKVMIYHGGGGPNSHMACIIDGIQMESNGDYGLCTAPDQVTPMSYWNDFWVYDQPITEDTKYRTPMTYPRGLDYAGGRISGASLKANGITFVCRYLSDGGSGLPGKQLLAGELEDLTAHGIAVVFNWETTADFMLGGANQGRQDATTALNYVHSIGGPANPVVYFSADFDATPQQQAPINDYLTAAAQVLGGPEHVGIYGGYWPLSRALDAGVCKYAWQSEAWSGNNVDARINIMQRNGLGYQTIDGVQCDINEAHTDDYGQCLPPAPPPPPSPLGTGPFMALTDQQQADMYNTVMAMAALVFDTDEQLRGPNQQGWPQLGQNDQGEDLSLVDGIAAVRADIASLHDELAPPKS